MASSIRRLSTYSLLQLRHHALRRGLTTTARRDAASNFLMPELSPAITEVAVSHWKLKEGDTFSAGEVILEVETDRIQIDVEAPNDGVLAKIMVKEGTRSVQVGSRIAVLAELGDDLASLEILPEKSDASAKANVENVGPNKDTRSPREEGRPSVGSSAKSTSDTGRTRKVYTPSPSVAHLLREHRISEGNAAEISATGPNGRLLKGDILAYLGQISKGYPKELEGRIHKLEKLDLSNIKIAPEKKAPAKTLPVKKEIVDEEKELKLEISFGEVLRVQNKLQEVLGLHLPLSAFITKATSKANHSLPTITPASDIFNELLDLPPPRSSRLATFKPHITASTLPPLPTADADILDILIGTAPATTPTKQYATPGIAATGPNVLALKVKGAQEEARGKLFLEKVKGLLERDPGGLVL